MYMPGHLSSRHHPVRGRSQSSLSASPSPAAPKAPSPASSRLAPWSTSYSALVAAIGQPLRTRRLCEQNASLLGNFEDWAVGRANFVHCRLGDLGTHGLAPPESLLLDHYSALKLSTQSGRARPTQSCSPGKARYVVFAW